MRERLIELMKGFEYECQVPCEKPLGDKVCHECKLGQLADYFLANGVVVPPVWVGNIVWFYVPHRAKPFELRKGRVLSVEYTLSMKPLLTIRYNDNTLDVAKEYWGNRAFATENEARTAMEEAEAALKGGAE